MGRFATMVCPLCARNRKILSSRWKDPEIRWDLWNENNPLIQIREGGGKKKAEETSKLFYPGVKPKRGSAPGAGWPTVETLTLAEAIEDPEYRKYILAMFEQIKKVKEIIDKYQK